jgi:hypothetical protein
MFQAGRPQPPVLSEPPRASVMRWLAASAWSAASPRPTGLSRLGRDIPRRGTSATPAALLLHGRPWPRCRHRTPKTHTPRNGSWDMGELQRQIADARPRNIMDTRVLRFPSTRRLSSTPGDDHRGCRHRSGERPSRGHRINRQARRIAGRYDADRPVRLAKDAPELAAYIRPGGSRHTPAAPRPARSPRASPP